MIDRATSRHLPTDTEVPTGRRLAVPRLTRVLLMIVASVIVSSLSGVLAHAAGDNVPGSVLTAGGAFAAALGLFLAIAHYTATE